MRTMMPQKLLKELNDRYEMMGLPTDQCLADKFCIGLLSRCMWVILLTWKEPKDTHYTHGPFWAFAYEVLWSTEI